jgi:hypothetical protein
MHTELSDRDERQHRRPEQGTCAGRCGHAEPTSPGALRAGPPVGGRCDLEAGKSIGGRLLRKLARCGLVVSLLLGMAAAANPPAHSRITGTAQGRVVIFDNRAISPNPSGLGSLVPARRILVEIQPIQSGTILNPISRVVTDDGGRFSVVWVDQKRVSFPITLQVRVSHASRETPGPDDLTAPVSFTVQGPNGDTESFALTVQDEFGRLGDIVLSPPRGTEETAAYLTTREFYDRIVAKSRNLRERMHGVKVRTRVPGFSIFNGITPLSKEVWITDGRPVSSPSTVAHELGHAATWAALKLNSAPINPASDYMMLGVPGWRPDHREFSKAAFLEGMADFWSLVWLFPRNVRPVFRIDNLTFNAETARVMRADGTEYFRCHNGVDRPWELPFCHTAALWDLHDDASDEVHLSIAQIVDILNAFPKNCISNGCRDELGFDALNHLDFLRNAPAALQTQILKVWQGNGIAGGN